VKQTDPLDGSFIDFFKTATGGLCPYDWQLKVAVDGLPDVLPVPTGLGKTEVVLAWAWRRLNPDIQEPLHLVVCLPMRSLVTQTVERLRGYFAALRSAGTCDIVVHQLMGGVVDEEWAGQPDQAWVLVGTQDQLLSRALNRGYGMKRFLWPVHFGLLNHDCRWLIDEVQLMGPGLWTTAQLDWMRRKRFRVLKPCLTTWMSATVGNSFLGTTDRKSDGLDEPSAKQVAFERALKATLENDPSLDWWRTARRPVEWWQPEKNHGSKKDGRLKVSAALAMAVVEKHRAGKLSLVICNTVKMAREVFRTLAVDHKVLLHSRFRGEDRERHEQKLLMFEANRKTGRLSESDPGLICVSTQVVEAGVDISAHRLWTELSPWPSMLQRLGRLNRRGEDPDARAYVWEIPRESGKKTVGGMGPYEMSDILLAKRLVDVFAPLSLEKPFPVAIDTLNTLRQKDMSAALQPKPSPLPRALDVHGLFSTERDVHGGFTDVSAFVRGTDPDLDVTVVWRDWSGKQPPCDDSLDGPLLVPGREGCSVSFSRLQDLLKNGKSAAWIWNDEDGRWDRVSQGDIRPGMLVMLKREVGGYDPTEGWTGVKSSVLAEVPRAGRGETLRDDPRTEVGYWSRLKDHLKDARYQATLLCERLGLPEQFRRAVVEAAALHDLGKAHPQWQKRLPDRSGIPDVPLAKTPRLVAVDMVGDGVQAVVEKVAKLRPNALRLPNKSRQRGCEQVTRLRWAIDDKLDQDSLDRLRELKGVRWAGHAGFRPGLRHEVASALAMWHKYSNSDEKPYPALAVYLAATHHGKARTVLRSTTADGDDAFGVRSIPASISLGGEDWPLDLSIAKDGADGYWDGDGFVLTGHGWTGLVADLLGPWRPEELGNAGVVPESEPRNLGPFALAYLEALVRVADWRASDEPSASLKPSEVSRG